MSSTLRKLTLAGVLMGGGMCTLACWSTTSPAAAGGPGAPTGLAPLGAAPRPSNQDPTTGLRIPTAHPRLWWTPERLARGRTWARGRSLYREDEESGYGRALQYVLTGDETAGRAAVKWLMDFTVDTDGVASDHARWFGEDAILTFDWCHDLMSPAERQRIIARWNGYLGTLNEKSWGGVGMESNNYYWGYLRNGLEWGIATYAENPLAPQFLDHAINARFRRSFIPFASGPGRGGVLPEGTQYGPYIPEYATTAFTAAADLGVNLWNETPFFDEVAYYILYATTPAPTTLRDHTRFELFPFNDDEKFVNGGGAEEPALAMFMLNVAERGRSSVVGQSARAWLDLIKPQLPPQAEAAAADPVVARDLSRLPLDYYAPGMQFLYARDVWGPGATVLHLQMGAATGVGHEHLDWGNFQLWRGGRWLTRETTGYGEAIANWAGGPRRPGEEATLACDNAIAHNVLLFDGLGVRDAGARKGKPRVTRLESRPDFTYAAVDLGDSYRCTGDCKPERDDNPFAGRVSREFLFVRALDALMVFDRVESSSERKPAAAVVKTFVLHTETAPSFEGNGWLARNGDQALRVWTLLPTPAAAHPPRVVVEGSAIGQYRVEEDTKGAPQSYFLHVLQGRGARDPDLEVSFQQDDATVTATLVHPSRGTARLVLPKGPGPGPGKFGFARSGAPTLAPLTEGVETIRITAAGPVWGPPRTAAQAPP